jgi:ArsR family transcriptional regulator, arsenate/arsenite/antimonite-responsive transcriptional repressor / arsenate reductase (thioredoxin)
MELAQARPQPLEFLKLLAHDIRWQILMALARSDFRVEELVKRIQQPHNLISYHLRQLRLKRVVTERRSTADGRDVYYSLNLDQVRQMYFDAGQALHPALRDSTQSHPQTETLSPPKRVLFLCTHNSARSQMAEALLRELGGDKIEVLSAGSEPTSIHPLAIKVMRGRGIDLREHLAKHLQEFLGQHFDYVVTVCDRMREVCPLFPGDPEKIHWSFADPAAIEGSLESLEKGFEDTARELTMRIQFLLLMVTRSRGEQE